MSTPGNEKLIVIGFVPADELVGEAGVLGERIRAQAEALAALSQTALETIESPFLKLPSYAGEWPLTSAIKLEEYLLEQAAASLSQGEKEPKTSSEPSAELTELALWEHTYYLHNFAGVYPDYGGLRQGWPPTGLTQDLIKWTDEMARNDWPLLVRFNEATRDHGNKSTVSVYPETDMTKQLLDEETNVEDEYTASQWLSERVLMHAYNDEFRRFDWVGGAEQPATPTHS